MVTEAFGLMDTIVSLARKVLRSCYYCVITLLLKCLHIELYLFTSIHLAKVHCKAFSFHWAWVPFSYQILMRCEVRENESQVKSYVISPRLGFGSPRICLGCLGGSHLNELHHN